MFVLLHKVKYFICIVDVLETSKFWPYIRKLWKNMDGRGLYTGILHDYFQARYQDLKTNIEV